MIFFHGISSPEGNDYGICFSLGSWLQHLKKHLFKPILWVSCGVSKVFSGSKVDFNDDLINILSGLDFWNSRNVVPMFQDGFTGVSVCALCVCLCVFAWASGNCKLVAQNAQNVFEISILGKCISVYYLNQGSKDLCSSLKLKRPLEYGGWHVFKYKLAVGFQRDDIQNLQLARWLKCWFKVQAVLNIWLVILFWGPYTTVDVSGL